MTTTHVVGINAGDLTPNGEKLSLPYFTMAGEAATSCDAVRNRDIAERNAKSKPVQAPLPVLPNRERHLWYVLYDDRHSQRPTCCEPASTFGPIATAFLSAIILPEDAVFIETASLASYQSDCLSLHVYQPTARTTPFVVGQQAA